MSPTTKARTPKALQKKKLTLRQATERWCETTMAIDKLEELREEAAVVLLANAKRTDRRTFFDRIAVKRTGGQLYLNQAAVREELPAERFVEGDLMARAKRGWSLELLK